MANWRYSWQHHFQAILVTATWTVMASPTAASAKDEALTAKNETLKALADQHRENRDRIVTWTGKVTVSDVYREQQGISQSATCLIEFVVDRPQDCYRWTFRQTDFRIKKKDGSELQNQELAQVGGVRRGQDFYRLGPFHVERDEGIRTLVLGSADRFAPAAGNEDFDPFFYLSVHDVPTDKRMLMLYEQSTNPYTSWKVKRTNNRVAIESRANIGINRYTLDVSTGALPVETYFSEVNEQGKMLLETNFKMETQQVENVWIPKKVTFTSDDKRQGRLFERTLEWTDQQINQPVSDDAFLLATIGARTGDKVQDTRNGEVFQIGQSELAAAPAPPPTVTQATSATPTSRWWLWGMNGGIIAFVVLVFIGKKYWSHRVT